MAHSIWTGETNAASPPVFWGVGTAIGLCLVVALSFVAVPKFDRRTLGAYKKTTPFLLFLFFIS